MTKRKHSCIGAVFWRQPTEVFAACSHIEAIHFIVTTVSLRALFIKQEIKQFKNITISIEINFSNILNSIFSYHIPTDAHISIILSRRPLNAFIESQHSHTYCASCQMLKIALFLHFKLFLFNTTNE